MVQRPESFHQGPQQKKSHSIGHSFSCGDKSRGMIPTTRPLLPTDNQPVETTAFEVESHRDRDIGPSQRVRSVNIVEHPYRSLWPLLEKCFFQHKHSRCGGEIPHASAFHMDLLQVPLLPAVHFSSHSTSKIRVAYVAVPQPTFDPTRYAQWPGPRSPIPELSSVGL